LLSNITKMAMMKTKISSILLVVALGS